jgi:UDP-N-acetylglucosamine 3-dehydrogenase
VGPHAPQIKDSGVLIDLAVHDIDIIGYLLQKEPTRICVNGGWAINRHKEDYAEIFLNYGAVSGYIQVNWITPVVIRELHVTGTKGYAKLNYISQELDFFQSNYEKDFNDHGDFIIKFGNPEKINIPVEKQEPLKMELQSFLGNIEKNTVPEVTGRDGMKALEIALKALKGVKYV